MLGHFQQSNPVTVVTWHHTKDINYFSLDKLTSDLVNMAAIDCNTCGISENNDRGDISEDQS